MSRALLLVAILAGCRDGAPTLRPNFELACRASNTATAAQLFCVRTDTRDGEIVRVLQDKLPVSSGPTAVRIAEPAGSFTTVCDATSTTTRSDLYCIRMNTQSGDMVLVNLQKIAAIPATK